MKFAAIDKYGYSVHFLAKDFEEAEQIVIHRGLTGLGELLAEFEASIEVLQWAQSKEKMQ